MSKEKLPKEGSSDLAQAPVNIVQLAGAKPRAKYRSKPSTKPGAKPAGLHGHLGKLSSPLQALKNKSVSVLAAYFSARGVEAKAEIREARKREDLDIRRQLTHHALGGDVVQVEAVLRHTGRPVDTRMVGDVADLGETYVHPRPDPPRGPAHTAGCSAAGR